MVVAGKSASYPHPKNRQYFSSFFPSKGEGLSRLLLLDVVYSKMISLVANQSCPHCFGQRHNLGILLSNETRPFAHHLHIVLHCRDHNVGITPKRLPTVKSELKGPGLKDFKIHRQSLVKPPLDGQKGR